jgi:cobalamin biosynthesis protein CobD/CbiB
VEQEIRRMHRNDRLLIYFWLCLMWVVLGFIFFRGIMLISSNYQITLGILAIAAVVGCFVTSALITLLRHLNDNCTELYTEDITNLQKSKC